MVLVFDTETTDRDAQRARIVQLAAGLYSPSGRLIASYSAIVLPVGFNIPADSFVAKTSGITQEVALEGVGLASALSNLAYLAGRADLLVCHNVEYDKNVVLAEAERIGKGDLFRGIFLLSNWYCTMLSAAPILKIPAKYPRPSDPYKWPNLTELHTHLFGEGFDGAHSALADVEATARCFFELQKQTA